MDSEKIFAGELVWILDFSRSMIDEWEIAERFDDAVVVPIEGLLAGNRRIHELELELEVAIRQAQ